MPTSDTHSGGSTSRIALTTDAEVLLVEDDLINQKLSRLMLERRGFKVSVVGNGRDALEALAKQSYTVVLMDIRMRVMGGLEFFYSRSNDYINIYENADEIFINFLKAQDITQLSDSPTTLRGCRLHSAPKI